MQPKGGFCVHATSENGMEEELDYEQRVTDLVEEFFQRRERLQFFHELEFSVKNEEEENPFLNAAYLEEEAAAKKKKKPKAKTPPKGADA